MRSLHAVLVERPSPRLVELLAAALDGSGPAILPLDGGLPRARLAELITAFAPDTVEDTDGVTTARLGPRMGVAESTAVIIGTSGSTGAPKGVELSASALLHSARASLARVDARPGQRWLCCLPATHIAGVQVLIRSLVSGTEPVLATRADAETVAGSGCSHVSLVPVQLQRLLADQSRQSDRSTPLAGFASVLLGGAAAPQSLLDEARAAGVPVVTTYGMSETCGGCVYDGRPLDGVMVRAGGAGPGGTTAGPGGTTPPKPPPLTGGLPAPPYPPGPPSGGTDPSVHSVHSVPSVSSAGRIWIRGAVLFSRYRGGVAGTEVVRDGWFRTGDLGQVDASGRLTVRGRADDVINTGGHKVIPGEVAAVLGTCPGVQDVAVVGQPDAEWGERVIAVVVPADRADPPTLELLRLHVRQRLPRYASPSRVVIVDAVPMLPSGKHDITRLKLDLLRREQTEAENVT
jgi:O-succinylbenzoic acid--CoA ligase